MAGESLKLSLIVSTQGAKQSVAELLAIQKAMEKTAEEAPGITRLAQSLGLNFKAAKTLAIELGLTADQVAAAVSRLRELNAVGADSKTRLSALTSELGLTADQFQRLDRLSGAGFKLNLPDFNQVSQIAFGFNNILQSIQSLAAAARPAYEFLIGSNEKLNAQLLSSQTNLASATRIFQDGTEITDSTDKINASRDALRFALKQIEKDTQSLVGVTSAQVNELFQITLTNAGDLNEQSKQFPGPIEAATSLTKGWAAALRVVGLPLDQARQEINSILRGQIIQDSVLAKNLNITNAQVNAWKSQGILVDELNKRLDVFVDGNAIAARSVAGISSNIQDLFERIGRQAGEPLFASLVDALAGVEAFLKENEAAINDFFSTFAENGAFAATEIGANLKPVLDSLIEVVEEGAPVAQNLFSIVSSGAITASAALGPTIALLGQIIAKALEGYKALSELILLNQINDSVDALDTLRESSNSLAQQAATTGLALKRLNDQRKEGALSADEAAREKVLRQQAQGQVEAIEAQITALKEIRGVTPEVTAQRDAEIASLEQMQQALSNASGGMKIQGKELEELGTSYAQLDKKVQDAQNDINKQSGGDPTRFKESVQQLIELTGQQVELGRISQAQAQERLSKIVSNSSVELEVQQKAQEAITKFRKQQLDLQKSDLDAQISSVEAAANAGRIPPVAAAEQVTALKRQQLQLQLADVEAAIAAEQKAIASGSGSQSRLKELQTQQKKLNADSEKEAVESQRRIEEARLKEINLAAQKRIDFAKLAETKAGLEIARLEASGTISKEDAEKRKLEATLKRVDAEVVAEQQRLNQLKALPSPDNPAAQKERQKQIADTEQKLTQIQIQATETRLKQRELLERQALERIDKASRDAERQLQASQNERIAAVKQSQIEGVTNEADAARQIEEIQNSSVAKEVELKRKALSQIQRDRQSGVISTKTANEREAQLTQELGQLNLRRLDAELSAVRRNRDERLRAIDSETAKAKAAAEARQGTLGLGGQALQRETELLNAQVGLQSAIANRQAQRLQFQLEDAKQAGNTVAAARIQEQLFANQQNSLKQQFESRLQLLEISEKQKANELEIQRIQAEIARLEAETAVKRAQIENKSAQEIANLQQVAQLRAQQVSAIDQAAANQSRLNEIARQQISVDRGTAQEKLNRDQQQARKQDQEQIQGQQAATQSTDQFGSSIDSASTAVDKFADALSNPPKIEARKDGGRVFAGRPYLVGEKGPEIVAPRHNGYVMTAAETAAIMNAPKRSSIFLESNSNENRLLLSEIRHLRSAISKLKPYQSNTFNLTSQQMAADAARLHLEISRQRIGGMGL